MPLPPLPTPPSRPPPFLITSPLQLYRSPLALLEVLRGLRVSVPCPVNSLDSLAPLLASLRTLSGWSEFTQTRLPHALQTFLALSETMVLDYTSSPPAPPQVLRSSYAMSIVRGVNGLADAVQPSKLSKSSVSSLAGRLGLPGWIVDVRHDASHNDLPR